MRQLWQSAPAEHVLAAEWDGVYVVYHRPSGKTHVLNEQTLDLLQNVLRTPQTREAALRMLAIRLVLEPDSQFAGYFTGLLDHLEELGLVLRS
jgi:PqqD family protein of HPr-rel-A system